MPRDSSHGPDSADDPLDAIELAAAEWLVLQDRGLNVAQGLEFERWLRADERHARTYAQLQETWRQLDVVPSHRIPLPPARGRRWPWFAGSLAAAAALVLGFLALAPNAVPRSSLAHRAITPIGGFERLTLPDGSVVRLNTASEVTFDFTGRERRVTLAQGEASFDVAKDKSRPFVVRVDGVDVRAVGTAFNVRRLDQAIDVLVTEGSVQLEDASSGEKLLPALAAVTPTSATPTTAYERTAGADRVAPQLSPVLGAGQRARIIPSRDSALVQTSVADVAPAEAARTLAWRSRRLEFSGEPLANIAAEFNRYNRHRLVIADAELGAQRFGGKFPADDFETLVRLLETNFGVVVERRKNETVLRQAPTRR
jgi:transmembrane sensor